MLYLINKVHLKKLDVKAQKCTLFEYSKRSKIYKVYISETKIVEESIHVKFDDKDPNNQISELEDGFTDIEICAKT